MEVSELKTFACVLEVDDFDKPDREGRPTKKLRDGVGCTHPDDPQQRALVWYYDDEQKTRLKNAHVALSDVRMTDAAQVDPLSLFACLVDVCEPQGVVAYEGVGCTHPADADGNARCMLWYRNAEGAMLRRHTHMSRVLLRA